ncbi:MAG: DUF4892 domain-containing protein [Pseudomonadota bacterium]
MTSIITSLLLLAALTPVYLSAEEDLRTFAEGLDDRSYLELTESVPSETVTDYLVPLGAMQKIRGVWAPRTSARFTGNRMRYTWRVGDGFSSSEVAAEISDYLINSGATIAFACEARACGSSVQWANRVFGERLLYGTEKSQEYRVFTMSVDANVIEDATGDRGGSASGAVLAPSATVLLYASARTNDRQYLRLEILDAP